MRSPSRILFRVTAVALLGGLAIGGAILTASLVGDAQPGEAPAVIAGGETGWPVSLAFSPNDQELARVCTFGHSLIDTKSWKHARRFPVGIRMLAYSSDGKRIATAEGKDGARLWRASDKGAATPSDPALTYEVRVLSRPERVLITPAEAQPAAVHATGFSVDGATLFTADALGHVKIWRADTSVLVTDIAVTNAAVYGAAFHPKQKQIAFGDAQGVVRIWDLEKSALLRELKSPAGVVTSVSYSSDGSRLVSTHADAIVMIWDPVSGKAQVESDYGVAAFSPDGRVLALGGSDVKMLTPATGAALRSVALEALGTPQGKVPFKATALAWSWDGKQLAVGSIDGSVRIVPGS